MLVASGEGPPGPTHQAATVTQHLTSPMAVSPSTSLYGIYAQSQMDTSLQASTAWPSLEAYYMHCGVVFS